MHQRARKHWTRVATTSSSLLIDRSLHSQILDTLNPMHPSLILQSPMRTHEGTTLRPSASQAASDSSGSDSNTALSWQQVFDERRVVHLQPAHANSYAPAAAAASESDHADSFCVYLAGPPAAASSAAQSSSASSAAAAAPSAAASSAPPPFVALLLHGGGHSSLAWACVTAHLKSSMHVLTFDLRGHGHTRTQNDNELSMSRLVSDVIGVVRQVYPRTPPLLVIGHSLGAALAVHVAASKQLPVCGLCMLDLVEGTAVDSLSHMSAIVSSRPSAFLDHSSAVSWALRSGALRNAVSARFSMPDQLVEGVLTTNEKVRGAVHGEAAAEGIGASDAVRAAMESSPPQRCYRWRTDLLASEPYWSGWFAGLSSTFLHCPAPKLLLLASADRLDPPLMVAQMQGKLQVDVVGSAGHSLQEDQPLETARKLLNFVTRHKLHTMASVWAKTNATTAAAASTAASTSSPASAVAVSHASSAAESSASSGTVIHASASVSTTSMSHPHEPHHALAHTHALASSLSPPPPGHAPHHAQQGTHALPTPQAHVAASSASAAQTSSGASHSRPPVPLFHE